MSELVLHSSRLLLCAGVSVILIAAQGAWSSAAAIEQRLLFMLLVSISGLRALAVLPGNYPFGPVADLKLRLGRDGCSLGRGDSWQHFGLPKVCYLGEWLVILELRPSAISSRRGWRVYLDSVLLAKRLVITVDSLAAADHWRLRRYLQDLPEAS